ncbi:MAG: fold metallo-hydrolase [Acidimicrobiaceae bacterium]|nr:fold metallo-hydrolase [Acidimicrobiaceae bacterium]
MTQHEHHGLEHHGHEPAGLDAASHEEGQHSPAPAPAEHETSVMVPKQIADGVLEIDTLLGGWADTTAGYLLSGEAPVLVETGSQSSVPVLLAALERLGMGPEDLAGIALTHIHLDHAGGVGDIAAAFPKATVYVHEKGARHLADPSRLVASAARVYGDLLDDLYGRLEPTDAARIRVLGDGDTVDIGGGRHLVAVDSPGHAKHHLGFHDETSGLLFAGDAVGVRLPDGGVLRPATPPPDFDLDLALSSLGRFARRRPVAIALAHYGVVPVAVDELLEEAEAVLSAWAGEAERAFREGRDVAEALESRFGANHAGLEADARRRMETLNGIHSNAAGLRRWLEHRDQADVPSKS